MFPLFYALLPISGALADHSTPLFTNDWVIEATIEAPFNEIMDRRSDDYEPNGTFTYVDNSGTEHKLDIKVRSRGRFRARKDICHFAPLRVNFKKKQVAETEFDGQDKIKLVTHCENVGGHYEQLVLREYLTYQFFSTLTEKSFGTRLLKLTYIDSEGESKTRNKFAFMIEDKDLVAERNHVGFARVQSLEFSQVEPQQTNLVTVFSYFIGNTDLSAIRGPEDRDCCHNVMLLTGRKGLFLPIPYDFDYSGMVDAPYAAPNPRFKIPDVKTRLYRGLCKNNDLLPSTFGLFEQRRGEIQTLVDEIDGLRDKTRSEVNRYIESFYDTIANEARIEKEFLRVCSDAVRPPSQT